MLALIMAVALQAAPAAAQQATPEQRSRLMLAARGMSARGIDAMVSIEQRHGPVLRQIAQRGQAAEVSVRQALAKRPIDAPGFIAANTARGEAAAALQREATTVANEQMRDLSPGDRIVLVEMSAARRANQQAGATPKR